MKIVLAFDSFKGSMSAEQAVCAAAEGIKEILPEAQIVGLPLADGGEGTTEVLATRMTASWHSCAVHDPLMRTIQAHYAISDDGKTAIMDMASCAGLTLLDEAERNPMLTTTYGVGEMILCAIENGCKRILLGIGGSATNDCGMGMLAALGVRFMDAEGNILNPVGCNMSKVADADWSNISDKIADTDIQVVCDVINPLYGNDGAAYVYAKQKGASAADVEALDCGLRHFSSVVSTSPLADVCDTQKPGAGAAGGLGYGLMLMGASLRKGVDVVLDVSQIDEHLRDADLLITGEGKIDKQTLCGKLPFGLLQRANKANVPVIAMAGLVEDKQLLLDAGFRDVVCINPVLNTQQEICDAMLPQNAMRNLTESIKQVLMSQ